MNALGRSLPAGAAVLLTGVRNDEPGSSRLSAGTARTEVVSKQATKVTALSTKLEWRIDQFDKLMKLYKNGQNLISRPFGCPQAPTVTWELHVYPNGKREEDQLNVSFFLRQVGLQRNEDPIMTEFQIYAIDKDQQRVSVCRDTKDFTNQQGRGKFQVSRDKMFQALRSDGSLLLKCEVEYFPPGSKISVEQADEDESDGDDTEHEMNTIMQLQRNCSEMLNDELFTDCTIKVGCHSLRAHRCFLGQNSAVFRSMFQNDTMIEAQRGVIEITDYKFETVKAMVDYMYTGALPPLDTAEAEDLLAIADKYAVLPLKESCERLLASQLSARNLTNMVLVADTFSASLLRAACFRFLTGHHRLVIRTSEWKQLKRERPELANDMLESVLAADAAGGGAGYSGLGGAYDSGPGDFGVDDDYRDMKTPSTSRYYGGGGGSSSSSNLRLDIGMQQLGAGDAPSGSQQVAGGSQQQQQQQQHDSGGAGPSNAGGGAAAAAAALGIPPRAKRPRRNPPANYRN